MLAHFCRLEIFLGIHTVYPHCTVYSYSNYDTRRLQRYLLWFNQNLAGEIIVAKKVVTVQGVFPKGISNCSLLLGSAESDIRKSHLL